MNRRVSLLIVLSMTFLIPVCRENNPMPKGSSAQAAKSAESVVFDPAADSLRTDSLFDALMKFETAVAANPDDGTQVQNLREKSLDTVAGCFRIVGTGMKNPDLPEDAQPAARKAAAKFSAEKWALYLKALDSGEKVTFGTPIQGRVLYTKVLRTKMAGDSLFVLVMVPTGSVVVKGR